MQERTSFTASNEINTKRKGVSKMAELIALHRVAESRKQKSNAYVTTHTQSILSIIARNSGK